MPNTKAPRNRTITLTESDIVRYKPQLLTISDKVGLAEIRNRIINQDIFQLLDMLPSSFADVLFIDPPYNLTKSFNNTTFNKRSSQEYSRWFESWFLKLIRTLKPNASIYICSDWQTSSAIFNIIERHLVIRNRITWEREKGRGAKQNWKNCSEDIWFCTVSDEYTFNTEAVKLNRRVLAPYTHSDGKPKDWNHTEQGNYRLTHPSNLWTDLTVPFWSMPENTDHPTQKPEKLLAKIILASSNPQDVIFDPFLGSGTSAIVAKKLDRNFVGIEIDPAYCCLALKRLEMADHDRSIQGYAGNIFWERNSLNHRKLATYQNNVGNASH